MEVAVEQGIRSLAFPSISTGAYGYPIAAAARVALRTVIETVRVRTDVSLVRFVLFSTQDLQVYTDALAELSTDSTD